MHFTINLFSLKLMERWQGNVRTFRADIVSIINDNIKTPVKLSVADTQSRHTTMVIGSYGTVAKVRSLELHSCFPTMPLFIPYREMSFGMSGVRARVARGCKKGGD